MNETEKELAHAVKNVIESSYISKIAFFSGKTPSQSSQGTPPLLEIG
jgi:hypothetical protein